MGIFRQQYVLKFKNVRNWFEGLGFSNFQKVLKFKMFWIIPIFFIFLFWRLPLAILYTNPPIIPLLLYHEWWGKHEGMKLNECGRVNKDFVDKFNSHGIKFSEGSLINYWLSCAKHGCGCGGMGELSSPLYKKGF